VGAAEDKGAFNATIWMFRVMPQASVSVTAGENSGHTLAYRNVVRDIKAVGLWKGQAVTLDLPRDDPANRDSIAVIVQQDGYGRILGAALADDSVKAATH
jgi:hypothetical protein